VKMRGQLARCRKVGAELEGADQKTTDAQVSCDALGLGLEVVPAPAEAIATEHISAAIGPVSEREATETNRRPRCRLRTNGVDARPCNRLFT
jgi:hypothetical protein